MELTRRDALAALAAGGITISGGVAALRWDELHNDSAATKSTAAADSRFTSHEIETLNAVAAIVYPSAITGIPKFIETYVVGRVQSHSTDIEGLKQAIATLDNHAQDQFNTQYVALSQSNQDTLLRRVGVDTNAPDPAGAPSQRIRYYLVNELLYALYTSPTGGNLVGIENPQGHPGGLNSYQQGPQQ